MRTIYRGLLLSLALSATAVAASPDPTQQVIIQCRCLTRYQQWMCEVFWWALC